MRPETRDKRDFRRPIDRITPPKKRERSLRCDGCGVSYPESEIDIQHDENGQNVSRFCGSCG